MAKYLVYIINTHKIIQLYIDIRCFVYYIKLNNKNIIKKYNRKILINFFAVIVHKTKDKLLYYVNKGEGLFMKSIKTHLILYFTLILFLSCSVLAFFSLRTAEKGARHQAEESLINLAKESRKVIKSRIEARQRTLETIAQDDRIASMDWQLQQFVLRNNINKSNFLALGIVYPDGTTYYADGSTANLGDREYVQQAFKGNSAVSDVIISKVTNEPVVMFASPIAKQGKVLGVLIGRADGNALSQITNDITYGQDGYAYMINTKGVVVAHKEKQKVLLQWSAIEESESNNKLESLAAMHKTMIEKKYGIGSFELEGRNMYNAYAYIEGTDWILAVVADTAEVLEAIPEMTRIIIYISLAVLAVAALITMIIGTMIARPIILGVGYAQTMAALDLTRNVPESFEKRNDEIGTLGKAFKAMQDSIKKMIRDINTKANDVNASSESLAATSEQMSASSQQLASTIQQVADGASSQAQDLSDIVESMSELTLNIENAYKELQNVKNETQSAGKRANMGKEQMDRLAQSIENVKMAFESVVLKVEQLTQSINEIKGITDIISQISSQTNLLALNAAIEAARAGEQGKGFAVVAEEVRKLAEASKKSADKISSIISIISVDSQGVFDASKNAEQHVIEQVVSVEETIKSFGDILVSINNISQLMDSAYGMMDKILVSKDVVMRKAEEVSAVTEQSAAATQEVAASTQELTSTSEELASTAQFLSQIASDLIKMINKFKV